VTRYLLDTSPLAAYLLGRPAVVEQISTLARSARSSDQIKEGIMADRVKVDGGELEYEVRGSGEPVLLIHGVVLADALTPLLAQPALAEKFRLVHYHRRGYVGSCQHAGPYSLGQQAADAQALLDHLGVERTHVVGHSYGGAIGLQLALEAPERVASLALLEPVGIAAPGVAAFVREVVQPAGERFARGDTAGAVAVFLRGACGPQMREVADRALPPGAYDLAAADTDTFFLVEGPAIDQWRFGPDEAARVTQPVLLVLGTDSDAVTPMFGEMNAALSQWLPRAESAELPGATHALQMMNPVGTAELLAGFLARNSLAAAVR
jgi:pimeloyl-ACP methyl ester carboxylesterase